MNINPNNTNPSNLKIASNEITLNYKYYPTISLEGRMVSLKIFPQSKLYNIVIAINILAIKLAQLIEKDANKIKEFDSRIKELDLTKVHTVNVSSLHAVHISTGKEKTINLTTNQMLKILQIKPEKKGELVELAKKGNINNLNNYFNTRLTHLYYATLAKAIMEIIPDEKKFKIQNDSEMNIEEFNQFLDQMIKTLQYINSEELDSFIGLIKAGDIEQLLTNIKFRLHELTIGEAEAALVKDAVLQEIPDEKKSVHISTGKEKTINLTTNQYATLAKAIMEIIPDEKKFKIQNDSEMNIEEFNQFLDQMIKTLQYINSEELDYFIKLIKAGDIEKLLTNIKFRLHELTTGEAEAALVKDAVLQEIPGDKKKEFSERIKNLGQINFQEIEKNEKTYLSYIEKMSSGSNTVIKNDNSEEVNQAKKNFKAADRQVREWASTNQKLDIKLISQLNKSLTTETRNNNGTPGAYRDVLVMCSNGYYLQAERVQSEMTKLCDWINNELEKAQADRTKIVEIAAKAFSWSVSIHPFRDGNGRTCRMIANYVLIKGGLPPAIIDVKRGKGARFALALRELEELKRNKDTHQEVIEKAEEASGPKPEKVMENMILSIEETLTNFGKIAKN
jgi:Fic family protein/coenzyme F420-reducing hydrogenase delta subunit